MADGGCKGHEEGNEGKGGGPSPSDAGDEEVRRQQTDLFRAFPPSDQGGSVTMADAMPGYHSSRCRSRSRSPWRHNAAKGYGNGNGSKGKSHDATKGYGKGKGSKGKGQGKYGDDYDVEDAPRALRAIYFAKGEGKGKDKGKDGESDSDSMTSGEREFLSVPFDNHSLRFRRDQRNRHA